MKADAMVKGRSYRVYIKKTSRSYEGTFLGLQPNHRNEIEHTFFPVDGLTSFSRIRIHPDVVGEIEEVASDARGERIAAHPAVARTSESLGSSLGEPTDQQDQAEAPRAGEHIGSAKAEDEGRSQTARQAPVRVGPEGLPSDSESVAS